MSWKQQIIIYYLSEFLWVSSWAWLSWVVWWGRGGREGAGGRVPLMKFQSRYQPGLQLSESLAEAGGCGPMLDLSNGWQFCAGCWQVASVSAHKSVFQGHLNILITWQLASPRVGNPREHKRKWWCFVCYLASEVTNHDYCHILFIRRKSLHLVHI